MPFSVPLHELCFWWPSSLHTAEVQKFMQDIGHTSSYFLCAGPGFAQPGKEKGDVITGFGCLRGGYREETDFSEVHSKKRRGNEHKSQLWKFPLFIRKHVFSQ